MNIVTATMFIGIVVKIIIAIAMAIPSINQFGSVAGNIMCFMCLVLNYYYIKYYKI